MKHTIPQIEGKIRSLRRQYAAGKLSADNVAKLEIIPGWTWNLLSRISLSPTTHLPP